MVNGNVIFCNYDEFTLTYLTLVAVFGYIYVCKNLSWAEPAIFDYFLRDQFQNSCSSNTI